MAAMSQSQAEATKEAQKAGISHAQRSDDDAYLGRKPSFDTGKLETVRNMLESETPIATIAKATDLTRQTIYRVKADPAWADGLLANWQRKIARAA
jgi:putative DNA-invertase from lambdoid prophage Rac